MKIESENIILKPTVFEDLDDFFKWEKTPQVAEFFSISDKQTKEDVIAKYVHDNDNPGAIQFTVFFKESDGKLKRIGRIVFGDLEPGWKIELWRIYIGDLDYRKRGLGRQAMKLATKYAFEELHLERLYLDHYTGNPASELYLSLGFQYEGILRSNCRKNGILYDVHLMSMLKDEYRKVSENW